MEISNDDNHADGCEEGLTAPLLPQEGEGEEEDSMEGSHSDDRPLETRTSLMAASTNNSNNEAEAVPERHATSRRTSSDNSHVRWFGLAAVCLVMTAEYYAIDIPAALHQELKDYMTHHSDNNNDDANFELRFNLLYTVYAMPNVVLPLLGGFLVDRWGPSVCMVGYSICLCVGQVIFAWGLSQRSWTLMLFGRTVFGLGGESICVAFSTLLSEWFDPSERAFAFGTQMAISRLGSVLNNIVSPKVAHSFTTPSALWLGVGWNAIGVIAAYATKFVHSMLHQQHRTTIRRNLTEPLLRNGHSEDFLEMERSLHSDDASFSSAHTIDTELVAVRNIVAREISEREQSAGLHRDTNTNNQRISFTDISRLGSTFWLLCICCMVVYGCILPFNNVASGILLERNYFQTAPSDCQLTLPQQCTSGTLVREPNPSMDSNGASCPGDRFAPILPTFPLNISTDDYDAEFIREKHKVACDDPFWAQECTQDYCRALHQATEQAGRTMSIPYAISAIISPPIGGLVDRIGRRAMLACGTTLTLMVVHLTLAYVPSDVLPVWIPLIGQGVAYALFSAVIWPSVGLVVTEKRMTGTAYGIILSAQNCGIALFPILVAAIYKASQQRYLPNVELLFAACAAVGSLAGVALWILDRRNGNKLGQVHVRGVE